LLDHNKHVLYYNYYAAMEVLFLLFFFRTTLDSNRLDYTKLQFTSRDYLISSHLVTHHPRAQHPSVAPSKHNHGSDISRIEFFFYYLGVICERLDRRCITETIFGNVLAVWERFPFVPVFYKNDSSSKFWSQFPYQSGLCTCSVYSVQLQFIFK